MANTKFNKPKVNRKPNKLPKTINDGFNENLNIHGKPPEDSGAFPGEEGPPEDQVRRTLDKLRAKREVATNKTINSNRVPTFTRKG